MPRLRLGKTLALTEVIVFSPDSPRLAAAAVDVTTLVLGRLAGPVAVERMSLVLAVLLPRGRVTQAV